MGKTVIKPNRPIKIFQSDIICGHSEYTNISYSSVGFTEVPAVSACLGQNGYGATAIVSIDSITKTGARIWFWSNVGAAATIHITAIGY